MILSLRLTAAIFVILLSALALTATLNYFKFESTLSGLQQSRISVISLNIKQSVQSGTDLGLALKELRDIQDVIDRARKADSQILSISVFDRQGRVLFASSADPAAAGTPTQAVAPEWVRANRGATTEEALWRTNDPTAFVVGAAIHNTFDRVIGGVAVRFSRAVFQNMLDEMLATLAKSTGIVLVSFGLLCGLVVFLVFASLARSARRMDERLQALLESRPVDHDVTARSAIEREFLAFSDKTEAALQALAEAEGRLQKAS